jgi:hypothetical protein
MSIISNINTRDPRLQEKLLATGVNNRGGTRGRAIASQLSQDFASQQAQTRLGFYRTETSKRSRTAALNLAKNRLKTNKKFSKQGLKDRRQDLNMNIIRGLGTTGLKGYIGYKNAEVIRAQNEREITALEQIVAMSRNNAGGIV